MQEPGAFQHVVPIAGRRRVFAKKEQRLGSILKLSDLITESAGCVQRERRRNAREHCRVAPRSLAVWAAIDLKLQDAQFHPDLKNRTSIVSRRCASGELIWAIRPAGEQGS